MMNSTIRRRRCLPIAIRLVHHSITRKGQARRQQDQITVELPFRVEFFYVAIDKQLQELNKRFNERALELLALTSRYQLQHFICKVLSDVKLSILQELCPYLTETGKLDVYFLLRRLIRVVLTFPISIATERAFSVMKIMKTRLRNKMEDDFFADSSYSY
ncbi:hypothetical protein RND81_12G232300 [Saponaria officinalis]|uniref:HAT C-terminal dimerisation domain-containing protein n=1 Tax=Saponaria officinalis TaxID=3572 RepID=A0AAW1HEB1_SAPOF